MRAICELLAVKAYANLRTEVSCYYLNYLWWVIEPVLTMSTFYLVFGVFLNKGTEHFVAFLLTGLVPWQWFANAINQASGSILNGRELMLQVYIPKFFFPFEVILRGTFKHLFVLILLLFFLVFYPTPVAVTWVALPVLMLIQFLFIVSIGTLCAAFVPFVPDLKFIVSTILQLAMYASGIFYNIDSVILPKHRTIIYMNPMAGLIKNYREVLMYAHWPDWQYLGYLTLAGLVLLMISVTVLFKLDHVYPRLGQK
ncbi:ABC transporter permease [Desulfovibrio gilichinskyi]|uniref:Transport permease protein n=1 Tax=Desulfovibrio gilichinskyi TaxID=1519643 RepID=A0A1X7EIU5_9BACT|nr:ABC transporter permease [Desulfovibrio gilichinskyi]SMF34670.1 lipopolysaccharide transport system permease protein [Desulfovibrio gilichinskyi]